MEESSACANAAARYRGKLEWPCTAHGHAVWTLAGQAVDAVDVPEGLPVSAVPDRAVIEVPGETWYWRYLVRPRHTTPHRLIGELDRLGARYHGHGSVIELPPTKVPGGELRWLQAPNGTLPTFADLLAALLRSEHKSSER